MSAQLDQLVEELRQAFAEESTTGRADGGRIKSLLEGYAAAYRDWVPFAMFDSDHYTRNLVFRDERFELLLLCWGAGQESPIHNHEGQDCWMAVLQGSIEEVRYPTPGSVQPGPLNPTVSKVFDAGQVAFIHDDIGLHLVRPAGADGVSLHLYAAPYDECNCYCPETGQITRRQLVNYSERGRLLPT